MDNFFYFLLFANLAFCPGTKQRTIPTPLHQHIRLYILFNYCFQINILYCWVRLMVNNPAVSDNLEAVGIGIIIINDNGIVSCNHGPSFNAGYDSGFASNSGFRSDPANKF